MPVKINGATSGSVTLAAPATGSDVTLTLPAAAGTAATTAYADSAGGLQLITTQTFSAVSAVNVNNCFTSTYQNYSVSLSLTATASTNLNLRFRAGGSDNIGANYFLQRLTGENVTASLSRIQNVTESDIAFCRAADLSATLQIFNPQVSQITRGTVIHTDVDVSVGIRAFRHATTTSFDGFSIYVASGTITGDIRIYGYKNGA